MKICPICKVRYSDEAEFCAKCKTVLLEEKEDESANLPVDKKRLWTAILSTCAFMLVVAGIYYLMGLLKG
ncbi:MAG: hypothetical protein IJP03_03860 [Christensenellaceae bacterium]|nr:hypothetical protein [Christensenellaceae bacterium]